MLKLLFIVAGTAAYSLNTPSVSLGRTTTLRISASSVQLNAADSDAVDAADAAAAADAEMRPIRPPSRSGWSLRRPSSAMLSTRTTPFPPPPSSPKTTTSNATPPSPPGPISNARVRRTRFQTLVRLRRRSVGSPHRVPMPQPTPPPTASALDTLSLTLSSEASHPSFTNGYAATAAAALQWVRLEVGRRRAVDHLRSPRSTPPSPPDSLSRQPCAMKPIGRGLTLASTRHHGI